MNMREEQREERRNKILEASLDLFVAKGYSGTKVSDITSAVGMSAGLFFHYFSSKDEVYEELVKIGLLGTQMSMKHEFDNPIDFFETVADQIFNMISINKKVAKMFVFMANAQQDMSAPTTSKENALKVNNIEQSIAIIKKGQDMGCIKQGDPLALSIAFWSAIQGIATVIALNNNAPCPKGSWVVDILRNQV